MSKTIGVRLNGNKWRWECCINGRRLSGTADTQEEAVKIREEKLSFEREKSVVPQLPASHKSEKTYTLADAVEQMLKADWSQAKSLRTIKINIDIMYRYFGKSCPLADVTTERIDGYIEWLRSQGNKGSSINRKIAIISKLLKRAYERGGLPAIPYIEHQPESAGRIRYITPEEEEEIYKQLEVWHEDRFIRVVQVLIDTGIRCGELLKLAPCDIQRQQGVDGIVYLHETKNGSSRGVPLTKRAIEALDYLEKTSTSHDRLISEYDGWITKTWQRLRIKLDYTEDKNFVPHILRHTCCSRLVQRGAPLKKVQLFMGHRTIQTTMRYAHLAPQELYDLPQLLENGGQ